MALRNSSPELRFPGSLPHDPVHRLPRKLALTLSIIAAAGMLDDTRALAIALLAGISPWLAVARLLIIVGFGGTSLVLSFRPAWAPVPFTLLVAGAGMMPSPNNVNLVALFLLVLAAMLLDWLRLLSMIVPYLVMRAVTQAGEGAFWEPVVGLVAGITLGRIVWVLLTRKELSERENEQLMREAREREEAAAIRAELMEQRFSAQRRELTRELHDVVAHELTRISMRATLAETTLPPGEAATAFHEIATVARGALGEMRRLVSIINVDDPRGQRSDSPPTPELGLDEQLERAETYLRDVGFRVEVVRDLAEDVPGSLRHAVGAVLREATTNVAKHGAPGTTCRIALSARDGRVRVEVQNEVSTASSGPRMPDSGLGISLLEARVGALGGEFTTHGHDGMWTLAAEWERLLGPTRPGKRVPPG